jgi:hypothetical protein
MLSQRMSEEDKLRAELNSVSQRHSTQSASQQSEMQNALRRAREEERSKAAAELQAAQRKADAALHSAGLRESEAARAMVQLSTELDAARKRESGLSVEAQGLQTQVESVRRELSAAQEALKLSESERKKSDSQVVAAGQKLNVRVLLPPRTAAQTKPFANSRSCVWCVNAGGER